MPSLHSVDTFRPTPLHPRRVAVIVGASSGIGAALARQLAREGYQLALLARRAELLSSLCEEINQSAGELRTQYYVHDVQDVGQVPGLLKTIMADLGRLDVFIYNSGISLPVGFKKYDFEKDRLTTGVNYIGALAWLNPVAELFLALKAGQIVGISSVAGDRGRVGNPSYNAAKAALTCYLEALRNRLTRFGVHVLTVKPGFVATDLLKDAKKTFLVASPEKVALDIAAAIRRRRQELYTPGLWRWIMLVVRHIPSFIFRKLTF